MPATPHDSCPCPSVQAGPAAHNTVPGVIYRDYVSVLPPGGLPLARAPGLNQKAHDPSSSHTSFPFLPACYLLGFLIASSCGVEPSPRTATAAPSSMRNTRTSHRAPISITRTAVNDTDGFRASTNSPSSFTTQKAVIW